MPVTGRLRGRRKDIDARLDNTPPKEPIKTRAHFLRESEEKVRRLVRDGYLKSDRIKDAMLKVMRRERLCIKCW